MVTAEKSLPKHAPASTRNELQAIFRFPSNPKHIRWLTRTTFVSSVEYWFVPNYVAYTFTIVGFSSYISFLVKVKPIASFNWEMGTFNVKLFSK